MRLRSMISLALLLFALKPELACGADAVPCSCLQEKWVDNPGPYDMYIAINHVTSCNDVGEEVLWYGWPSSATLPQNCGENVCEEYQVQGGRSAALIPGHGQELVGVKAWDVFRAGLESSARKSPGLEFGSPSYCVIPRKNLPAKLKATRDMIVMAIPVISQRKDQYFDGKPCYLCIQIDSADGVPISKSDFEDVRLGPGHQLLVKLRAKSGETRKGFVWLK
jgi:hypothetical protein